MLTFENWCIHCGVCWMFLIMLSFEQQYILICLVISPVLEGGATFFFLVFSILYFLVFYCSTCIITVSLATSLLLKWMNKWLAITAITVLLFSDGDNSGDVVDVGGMAVTQQSCFEPVNSVTDQNPRTNLPSSQPPSSLPYVGWLGSGPCLGVE